MDHIEKAIDARQTPMWGTYLKSLGWKMEKIGKTIIFVRSISILRISFIKIQHPIGPLQFNKIDDIARKYNAVWTLIEPHTVGFNKKDFIKHGYTPSRIFQSHTATHKIDLKKSEKELFRSFSENARRNIKKAQKEKLETQIIFMKDKKNWKYFDVFYELLVNLGRMKKFYVPGKMEFNNKMKAFVDTSILLFAYEKGKPVAVVWYASFAGVIAYFQTGITRRGYETLANYLLVWEGMLLGKKLGSKVFDFEAIYDDRFPRNTPRYKNYTAFKGRFHGRLIEYPRPWIKFHSIVGKLLYLCQTR